MNFLKNNKGRAFGLVGALADLVFSGIGSILSPVYSLH